MPKVSISAQKEQICRGRNGRVSGGRRYCLEFPTKRDQASYNFGNKDAGRVKDSNVVDQSEQDLKKGGRN
jgi:hypothetical protein